MKGTAWMNLGNISNKSSQISKRFFQISKRVSQMRSDMQVIFQTGRDFTGKNVII